MAREARGRRESVRVLYAIARPSGLTDGGVRFVSASIDHDTWAAISSVDGGEAVRGDAL